MVSKNAITSREAFIVRLAFLAVTCITFLCFFPDLFNDLLDWDDNGYILENDHIKYLSLDTVRWAFTDFYANYWAPLMWLSFALDYAIWGMNPAGYHLTNNILHALNAGMFFLLSLALIRIYLFINDDPERPPTFLNAKNAISCSILAALLFAIHPLRVESVAWAAERKDVLSLFFGLLAVLAYLKYARSTSSQTAVSERGASFIRSRYYWLTVALFCLSLLSKSMLVLLPLVLLVIDWFPLERFSRHHILPPLLEKAPLLLFAGIASIFTLRSQVPSLMSFDQTGLFSRILIALRSITAYLWLTIWPLDLSPFYIHPGRNISDIGLEHIVPILLFAAITGICALLVKRKPVFMTAWLIFLILLFPVLGISQAGPQAMAGRFTYAPSLALSLLLALGLTAAYAKMSDSRPAARSLLVGLAAMMLVNCYFTIREISYWKDDLTLWSRVIYLQPHISGRVYFQRSLAYSAKGDYHSALDDVNEALTIAIRKNYGALHEIYRHRAQILIRLGDLDGALADYTTAIASVPAQQRSLYYRERGGIYREQGDVDRANEDFSMASMPGEGR